MYGFPNPILDIIFVHGLGGTSRGTWSWERDPSNFWPPWLADDSEFSRARIFTFGYNANFNGQYTSNNILDFARDLLLSMKIHSGDGHQGDAPIGEVQLKKLLSPGKLILTLAASHYLRGSFNGRSCRQKGASERSLCQVQSADRVQAYILGKNNQQYESIIAHISAMVFLATPHRGSAFAAMLNNILKASPTGSAKNYVAELEKQSGSLQDINEQFRNICGSLQLVSFHETIRTSIGAGIKKMVGVHTTDHSTSDSEGSD